MKLVAPIFVAAGIALVAFSFGGSACAADYYDGAPRYYGWSGDGGRALRGTPVAYRATQHYYLPGKQIAYGFVELTKAQARRFPADDRYIISSSEFSQRGDASRLVFRRRTVKNSRAVKLAPSMRGSAKSVDVRPVGESAVVPAVPAETAISTLDGAPGVVGGVVPAPVEEIAPAPVEVTVPPASKTTIAAPVSTAVDASH